MSQDDEFGRWLSQVAQLDADDHVEFNAENHRDVLLELGYTESELERVDAIVENHLARARQHARFERWSDASSAFDSALSLAPWLMDVWVEIAQSYLELYAQTREQKHAQSCESWARKRIAAFPDEETAYGILNQLDARRKTVPVVPNASKRGVYIVVAIAVVVIVFGLSLAFRTSESNPATGHIQPVLPSQPPIKTKLRTSTKQIPNRVKSVVSHTLGPISVIQPTVPAASKGALPGTYGFPLTVDGNQRIGHLRIDASLNRLEISEYGSRHSAKLKMRIVNMKGGAIADLKGTVEWLDASGERLGSKQVTLVSSASARVRPGEAAIFGGLESSLPKGTSSGHFVVMVSKRLPDQKSWPPSRPMCVKWEQPRSPGIELDVRLRSLNRSSFLWRYEIEIENKSEQVVSKLIGKLTLYDAQDNPIGRTGNPGIVGQKIIATSWKPPFLPGETRVVATLPFVSDDQATSVDRACLRITNIN